MVAAVWNPGQPWHNGRMKVFPRRRLVLVLAALALVGVGCSDPDEGSSPSASTKPGSAAEIGITVGAGDPADAGEAAATGEPDATVSASADGAGSGASCAATSATPEGEATPLSTLQEAGADGPRVDAAVYPRPDHEGNPWSQWGQGVALADGRFFSGIGDHLGIDGSSYLFVYDPVTNAITRFADVPEVVGHVPGDWGYGKIHSQMVVGPDCAIYATTYWGTRRGLEFAGSYRGDWLVRIDPSDYSVAPVAVPLVNHGIPSMAGGPDGQLYVEAVDPLAEADGGDTGVFAVLDPTSGQPVFSTEASVHPGFRNILVDARGRAHVSVGENEIMTYDPETGSFGPTDVEFPAGDFIRASTVPGPDGTVYGVMDGSRALFSVAADGTVASLGTAPGYTTSLALHPDGSRLYFVPGAHGGAYEDGTPVIEVDTETGEQTILVRLNDLAEDQLGLTLGGTYDIAVDPSGARINVGLNAGITRDEPWGEVVLAVITLDD